MRVALLTCCLLLTPMAHAAMGQDGLYEIAMTTEMPGMPAGMGNQVIRECMKKSDMENPQALVTREGQGGGDCTVSDTRQSGDTFTFTMTCPQEHMTGKGEYLFHGDSYTGKMTMQVTEGGATMNLVTKTRAKRVGPCP